MCWVGLGAHRSICRWCMQVYGFGNILLVALKVKPRSKRKAIGGVCPILIRGLVKIAGSLWSIWEEHGVDSLNFSQQSGDLRNVPCFLGGTTHFDPGSSERPKPRPFWVVLPGLRVAMPVSWLLLGNMLHLCLWWLSG